MTFAADLVTDMAHMYSTDEFAETISYRLAGETTGTSVPAVPEELPDSGSEVWKRWRINLADVASPQRIDQITDDAGNVWTVRETGIDEGGEVLCDCTIAQTRG